MSAPLLADAKRHAAAYAQRMNRVLDHIDRHLDEALELADLAAVAHFSPFHFHRVFAAWMGETLGDYLRRRRLDTAARRLANAPGAPVLDIALGVGFGSGEAFARAFKLRFGCTPSEWRAQTPQRWLDELAAARRRAKRNPDQAQGKDDQADAGGGADDGDSSITEFPMDVRIVTLEPARIAYLRHIGPYGPGVASFWPGTFMPWLQASGLGGRAMYGIARDDPAITDADKCRYDCGVEIPEDFAPPAPAVVDRLPGGRYAVAEYYGHGDAAMEAAYAGLLREWLPASGMQVDARPIFEYYPVDMRFDLETGEFGCRLCVPVRPA
jgi:AraC family transcriptional regulator